MLRLLVVALTSGVTALFLAGCSGGSGSGVKVAKSDGSVQCESAGISLDEMKTELTDAGVRVLCAVKAGDGYLHPAVCGADTGLINVYAIMPADLSKAESAGFISTSDLPDYQDQGCG